MITNDNKNNVYIVKDTETQKEYSTHPYEPKGGDWKRALDEAKESNRKMKAEAYVKNAVGNDDLDTQKIMNESILGHSGERVK